MKVSVYNILWADNNCDSLKKNMVIREAFDNEDYTIEVLNYSHTTNELERDLELYKDRVDAVVIGDNLRRDDAIEESDDGKYEEVSGLIHAYSLMERYNSQREIPFILRPDNIGRANITCNKLGLKYFTEGGRIAKDDQLAKIIVEFVDKINSPEHRVEQKYKVLLDMAASLDKSKRPLLSDMLLKEEKDNMYDDSPYSLFNPLRGIMESLVGRCAKDGIIPRQIKELNEFKGYFVNKFWKDNSCPEMFSPIEGLMPSVMTKTLGGLIDLIQDGSHEKTELPLYVTQYVRDTKTPFVLRSCMYQVMDVIRWYWSVKEEMKSGSYAHGGMWLVQENKDYKRIEELPSDYHADRASDYEGKLAALEKDNNGIYHCAECSINPYAIEKYNLKVGSRVMLIKPEEPGYNGYRYKARIKPYKMINKYRKKELMLAENIINQQN